MILYAGSRNGKDITHTYFIEYPVPPRPSSFDQNLDGFGWMNTNYRYKPQSNPAKVILGNMLSWSRSTAPVGSHCDKSTTSVTPAVGYQRIHHGRVLVVEESPLPWHSVGTSCEAAYTLHWCPSHR
jgi:hypothetical protein